MTGRRSFATLRAKMTAEAQARAAAKAEQLREQMDLAELRRAHKLSQEKLA
jgi:DNA-binding transcriptional regulator YiaG